MHGQTTSQKYSWPRKLGLFGCGFYALSFCTALAQDPVAPTVTLQFEPPTIAREQICSPRVADEQLAATWETWDGQTLPDQDPDLILRDLKRLLDIDPIRWFNKIDAAYVLLPAVDSKFTGDKALLAKAELLIAAGRMKDLTNQRLVPQLLESNSGNSPRVQNILADYLIQGIGIPADRDKGMAMLVAAGYGGNADALLKIVELQLKGTTVPNWDVPNDIAVTMAFGALVGKLDPAICDRVARIAREYTNGTIVTRDIGLSERWFRFAADLGDSASAWKVAEMHMRSEDLIKSNDVLIDYLAKAAEGGLPYAQVALGRLYETGALVDQHIDRARTLYAEAAAYGDRAGLIRNALFLQAQAKLDPAQTPAYRAALEGLVQRDDAPSWAFIAMGDFALKDKGRWAGEAEAIALFEQAINTTDFDASKRLTPIRFRYAADPAAFYSIVDEVIQTVSQGGEIDPMNGLKNAFACRAPDAPQRIEADYWDAISASTDTKTVDYSPEEILEMVAHPDTRKFAQLQTQALYGRPSALAQFMALLERLDTPASEIAFWQDYAARFPGVDVSRGRLEHKFARITTSVGDPLMYLRRAIAKGDITAGIDLAEILIEQDLPGNAAEAFAVLEAPAALGMGGALQLLPIANPDRYPSLETVMAEYGQIIDDRGDFEAILLALPFQTDPAQQADYIGRLVAETNCSFEDVLKIAEVMGRIGNKAEFAKWTDVADYLMGDDNWRMVQLGDVLSQYGDETTMDARLAYYQRGYEGGNMTAIHRLLDVFSREGSPRYDAAVSAGLFVDLVTKSDPDDVPRALERLALATPEIKALSYAMIDLPAVYLASAEAGNAAAMREYGKLMMASAETADQLKTSVIWLRRAADAGDVRAMVNYADALAFGIGLPPSRDEALVWLARAADLGSAEAQGKVRSLSLLPDITQ
jgi:TPR repeat protein